MVKQVESGALESFLTHSARGRKVLFRDMSWQADTVYQRQRPRNFGSQASMLGRIGGTVAVAAFGQELRGGEYLSDFGYPEIRGLAAAARADDPFGYRGEFISLVDLAASLSVQDKDRVASR